MSNREILLLGADGQVGFELRRSLSPLGLVHPATRRGGPGCLRVDLGQSGEAAAAIRRLRPQWVVNAAAYTAVDRAEQEAEAADRVNHLALAEIAEAAQAVGAKVIHYSTDYVFNGAASSPYLEQHPTEPLGVYGVTKRAGEVALAKACEAHLILRTAWVYASRGHNFLRSMLRLAAERPRLTIVSDQIGAPTPARQIADATAQLLAAQDADPQGYRRWGTYHLSAAGQTSWYGFACAIIDAAAEAGWLINKPTITAIATVDFPTPARRPAYSKLDCGRLRDLFGIALPSWETGLAQVLGQLMDPQRILPPSESIADTAASGGGQ